MNEHGPVDEHASGNPRSVKRHHPKQLFHKHRVACGAHPASQLVIQQDRLQDLKMSRCTVSVRPDTRHTGSSSNRKLPGIPNHQLLWPPGSLCVYLGAPASRGPHGDLCFVSDIKGNELLERKPETKTSSGNEKDQDQVKEQMTFLPEKYQEYSLNPTSFKSRPIQSRDPASPAQRGLDLYQDTAS